jgi:hypothetical protein
MPAPIHALYLDACGMIQSSATRLDVSACLREPCQLGCGGISLLVCASPQLCDGLSVAAVKRRSPKTYVIAITNVELPAC